MKKIYLSMLLLYFCGHSHGQSKEFDSLKTVILTAGEDIQKVNLINKYASDITWVFPDTSVKYSMQSLELSKRLNYRQGEWASLKNLGFAFTNIGNYTSSLDYLYQSLDLANNLHDTTDILWSYVGLAICYRELGDFPKSENSVYKARNVLNPNDSSWWQAGFDDLVSGIFEQDNKLDSALFYANRAYPKRKNNGYLLFQLGNIHSKLGHNAQAFQYYKGAILLEAKDNALKDIVDTYNGIALLYWKEKKSDSAIYYAKLALIPQSGITFPIGVFRASGLLAEIYESQKKMDSTLKYLKLNISLKDSLFNQQKIRQAQDFAFNEQLHQQKLQQQLEQAILVYKNRLNIYFLLGGLVILIILAGGLWRRNVYKQKSYTLLQKQKQEIDIQKTKVEKTLEELKSTQAQLIQSEKMASLGELTAGIAHEIQNPLNFVNNFSEVNTELSDELAQEAEKGNIDEIKIIVKDIKANSEKINHHGKRADAIVKGMLQHSQASTGKKEPTYINSLADEYLRLSYHNIQAKDKSLPTRQAGFNATLKTDFDESIGNINIIPQDIGKVLLNLYNNAFYAVNEKQTAESLKPKAEGNTYEPEVTLTTRRLNSSSGDGGKISISVTDNGNGIPQKIADKIFQPFFTTKPTGQGTGLGLSLSYDIIKAHGGEIKVNTIENEGTEFIIQLPII